MLFGVTAFKHRCQLRNSYPTKSTLALTISYLSNYGDFTPLNTLMFMYINIYGEIESRIKKNCNSASLTPSGCLWKAMSQAHKLEIKGMWHVFILSGSTAKKRNGMAFVIFITQGDKLICGWWCAAPKWDLLYPRNCINCPKREESFHATDRCTGSPEEVRLSMWSPQLFAGSEMEAVKWRVWRDWVTGRIRMTWSFFPSY